MSSKVRKETHNGIRAFVPLAEHPHKQPEDALAARLSSILAPDTVTALQKLDLASSKQASPKEGPGARGDGAKRNVRGGRRKKDLPAVEVNDKKFAEDIKTTRDLAEEVTTILGPNLLGALKSSGEERKYQTKVKNSECSQKQTAGKVTRSKNTDIDEEDGSDWEPKSETAGGRRQGRIRHEEGGKRESRSTRAKTGEASPRQRTRRPKATGDLRSRSMEGKPKERPSRPATSHSPSRREKNQYVNHAVNVGIDLEDGMDEIFDEKDDSPARRQNKSPSRTTRVRKSRRDPKSTDLSGGSQHRLRGRNGARGRVQGAQIKQQQNQLLTAIDHTKIFVEEDLEFVEQEVEDPDEDEDEEVEAPPEDGLLNLTDLTGAAVATANMAATLVSGAVFGTLGTVATMTSTTIAAATTEAANAATMTFYGAAPLDECEIDDAEDVPKDRASSSGGPSWGFTGGGFAS